MCLDVRLSSCTWVFSDLDVCCIWVCVFAVYICVAGCASMNWCTWGCVNLFVSLCVCVRPCVDGRGRGSLRVHMQLFPSVSFMCRELCPHIFTPPPASRSPECGCFPLSLPLGTGPDLLPSTGEVGVCKHVEGPTQQPLHKALSAGRPGWSFCFGGENWTPLLGFQWALWILGSGNPCSLHLGQCPSGSAFCACQMQPDSWETKHVSMATRLCLQTSAVQWFLWPPLQAQRWDGGRWWGWVMKLQHMCAAPHPQYPSTLKCLHTRYFRYFLGEILWCSDGETGAQIVHVSCPRTPSKLVAGLWREPGQANFWQAIKPSCRTPFYTDLKIKLLLIYPPNCKDSYHLPLLVNEAQYFLIIV